MRCSISSLLSISLLIVASAFPKARLLAQEILPSPVEVSGESRELGPALQVDDLSGAKRFLNDSVVGPGVDNVVIYGERRFGPYYEPVAEPPETDPDTGYPINWVGGFGSYALLGGLHYGGNYGGYGYGGYGYGRGGYARYGYGGYGYGGYGYRGYGYSRGYYRPGYVPYGYGYGWGYSYPFAYQGLPYTARYRYAGLYAPGYTYRPYTPYPAYISSPYDFGPPVIQHHEYGGCFSW